MSWGQTSNGVFPLAAPREERRWKRLAMLWAIYYLAIYSIGQDENYVLKVIWMGAALVGMVSLPTLIRNWRRIAWPMEGFLLLGFSLWSLTGYFIASNQDMFANYLRQIVELSLIVMFVSVIIKYSGGTQWFFWAFWGVALYSMLFQRDLIGVDQLQVKGRIASANTLGFNCFMGLFGALALWGETEKWWLRSILIAGGLTAIYGVVLSASRGAFISSIILVVLWAPLCLIVGSRYKFLAFLGAVFVLCLGYWTYELIVQDTYMGTRFTQASHLEDNSSQTRLELVFMGWQLFKENPMWGCGVGQFGVASGRGLNAHSEVVEIAATTGVPGLILYYSVFILAWKRLSRSFRALAGRRERYRINIARIALLTLVVSGGLTRPNFISQNTMFMLGVVVGVAHWAERIARRAWAWNGAGRERFPRHPPNAFGGFPCVEASPGVFPGRTQGGPALRAAPAFVSVPIGESFHAQGACSP